MMRPLLLILSLFGAVALACGNPGAGCGPQAGSCATPAQSGCGCSGKTALLETITYAIDELGLADHGDIRTALALYKKEMRALKPHIPTEAFDNGKFDHEVYANNATPALALKAQSDLFETIYLVLNDEQKKAFPQLMGMYQHHMQYAGSPKMCGPKAANCCSTPSKTCGPKDGSCCSKAQKTCGTTPSCGCASTPSKACDCSCKTSKTCGPKALNCCSSAPKLCDTPPAQGCGGKNCKTPMLKKAQTPQKI